MALPEREQQSSSSPGLRLASNLMRELADEGQRHIPTRAMLDFAFGGLDDELMEILYGDHLGSCASCARGLELYRRQRPAEPARLMEVPELSHCEVTDQVYRLEPGEAGLRLRQFIADGSGALLIVAGEANPAVYDAELATVLRVRAEAAKRTGDPIPQVICGPAIGLDEKVLTPADTVLPALADEKLIQLYAAKRRQKLHFRISGEADVYTEEYHQAGNPSDRHGYWYKSPSIAGLFRRRFEAILKAGLAREAERRDFVFLPMDRIRQIQATHPFDHLTAEDLCRLAV